MTVLKLRERLAVRAPALPAFVTHVGALLFAVAGIAIVGYAQYHADAVTAPFDIPFTGRLGGYFDRTFRARNSLEFALPLFVAGGLILARVVPPSAAWSIRQWRDLGAKGAAWRLYALLGVPLVLWGWLNLRLYNDHYEGSYRWIFFLSIALALAAFLAIDRGRGRLAMPRFSRAAPFEALYVLALAGIFIGINARDLDTWRYAAIGDEGAFYDFASRVLHGQPLNWFSQRGPYDQHPILSSAYQALSLRVFGDSLFGWKMASVVAVVLTLPVFYWLLREMSGARVAIFGTLFLAASHYLFAYAHTGYDNIFTLFPTVAALACAVAGMRRGNYTLLFAAGLFAGMGFYTYYSSRAAIGIVGLAMLFMGRRHFRLDAYAVVGAGFVMFALPIFATDRWLVIDEMFNRSATVTKDPLMERMYESLGRTFLSFNFNPANIHYTAGPLMDGISVTFAMAGLVYAFARLNEYGSRVLIAWLIIAGTVAGLMSEYDFVSISRMHYALPPMAAFAGIAADRLMASLGRVIRAQRAEWALTIGGAVALGVIVFIINGQRFFGYSAEHSPTTPETVIVRELTRPACREAPLRAITYTQAPEPVIDGLWKFFGMGSEKPVQISRAEGPMAYQPYPLTGGVGCVAVGEALSPEMMPISKRMELGATGDGSDFRYAVDESGGTKVAFVPATDTPRGLRAEDVAGDWRTNPDAAVLGEVVQGQTKDAFAPIDSPTFAPVTATDVSDFEPVVVIDDGEGGRAYPLRVLMWNGVVNDVIAGVPVAVSYDTIGSTPRVFRRDPGGRTLTLGLSGLLRHGNAIIYDRETETWWQQATGEAIAGELNGQRLAPATFTVSSWAAFRSSYPQGRALTTDSRYDRNPYLGYDTPGGKALFTRAAIDGRLPAMQRVLLIEGGGRPVAVPFPDPKDKRLRAFEVESGGRSLVVFFDWNVRSMLERARPWDSRMVGSAVAFAGTRDGGRAFDNPANVPEGFIDDATSSRWDFFGAALEGPDAGQRLEPVVAVQGFWFSIAALYPDAELIIPEPLP